ncbi:hypothetical protein EUTSA_v10019462mg, partial [Eutrema salsugineum]
GHAESAAEFNLSEDIFRVEHKKRRGPEQPWATCRPLLLFHCYSLQEQATHIKH